MTDVSIEITDINPQTKSVKITGQLDESNVDEKIKEVYAVLQGTSGLNLLFDFENLEYMNSKSIGYLTDLYGKVTELGGKVIITKARPNIEDILQVVGLNQLIPMVGTNEEAMLKLGSAPAPTPTPQPTPVTPQAQAQPTMQQAQVQAVPTEPMQATPAPAPQVPPATPAQPQAIDLSQVEPPAAPTQTQAAPQQMPQNDLQANN